MPARFEYSARGVFEPVARHELIEANRGFDGREPLDIAGDELPDLPTFS